jgi:hypothetical protein
MGGSIALGITAASSVAAALALGPEHQNYTQAMYGAFAGITGSVLLATASMYSLGETLDSSIHNEKVLHGLEDSIIMDQSVPESYIRRIIGYGKIER